MLLVWLQVLNEPSVQAYYLGEERIVILNGTDKLQWWPKKAQIPLPNCTWKDLYDQFNKPYEGKFKQKSGITRKREECHTREG